MSFATSFESMVDAINRRCANAIAQQLRDVGVFCTAALDSLEDAPPPGSQRQVVNDWLDANIGSGGGVQATARLFGAISDEAWRGVTLDFASIADHGRALVEVLRMDPSPVAAPLSLARVGVEAAVAVCFLLDAAIPPERSLLRATAFLLAALEARWKTANDYPPQDGDPGPAQRAAKAVRELRKHLDRSGITVALDKQGAWTARLEYGNYREALAFNVSEAVRAYLPDWAEAYSVSSGATHSRSWATSSFFGELIGEVQWHPADVAIATASLAFSTSDALVRALSGHFGIDATKLLADTHHRRKVILGLKTGEYDQRTAEEYAAAAIPSPRVVPRYREDQK